MDFLATIIKRKREEAEERGKYAPLVDLKQKLNGLPTAKDFAAALSGGGIRIIAEMKKASPSAGELRRDFRPAALASAFEEGGAAAVSVLTDEKFFHGHLDHIKEAQGSCTIPILRKDFIISEYQVYESRAAGADAFLLIAAILEPAQLKDLSSLGRSLNMIPLIEVHSRAELDTVLPMRPEVIGINNRDLTTFVTDVSVTENLIGDIPEATLVVSESGIGSRKEIERLSRTGVDAFLIGEALMRSNDIVKSLEELCNTHERRSL